MPVQFTGSIQHCSGAPRIHRKTDKIHNNKKIRENQICFNSEMLRLHRNFKIYTFLEL